MLLAAPRPSAAPAPSSSLINLAGSGCIAYRVNSNVNNDWSRGPMHIAWLQGGKKFRYNTNFTSSIPAGSPEGALARSMTRRSWSLYDGTYFYMATPSMSKRVSRRWAAPEFAGRVASKPYELVGALTALTDASKLVGRGVVLSKSCEIRQTSVRYALSNGGSMRSYARVWMWRGLPLCIE
jgi:hypothetical protein